MVKKKVTKKRKDFSMQFMMHSEIKDLSSDGRIKKILKVVRGNKILILQGKLKAEEEARLIRDTMAMIDYVKDFRGIELAVISSEKNQSVLGRIRQSFINILAKTDLGTITIIGPATVVKEIKKNPKKIELLLER